MDRARDKEFVLRLPAADWEELEYREEVTDRQVLLNEEWRAYALRSGKGAAAAEEEHVKWVTETWEEWEARKRRQREYIDRKNRLLDAQAKAAEEEKQRRRVISDETIALLMGYQAEVDKKKTPSRHHLYADFDELQALKFRRQREFVENEESLLRTKIEEWEDQLAFMLSEYEKWSKELHLMRQREREAREEEERRRLEEERRRAEEEARLAEERRKREEEEAERRRLEELEAQRRADRKRREEERKARARAERERQKEAEAAKEPTPPPEPEPEPVVVEREPTPKPQSRINFTDLEGEGIVNLLKSLSKILSSGGDNCYIMNIKKNPGESTVICQNGVFIGENGGDTAPLLGRKLDSESCVSVSSEILHSKMGKTEEAYIGSNTENIADIRQDDRCELFCEGAEKQEENLALFPIMLPQQFSYSPYVVALSRDGASSLTEDEINGSGKLVYELCLRLQAMMRRAYLCKLCQQCVEWLNICTGCDDVYINLDDDHQGVATYVAATSSHRFLLGKTRTRADADGITFAAMDASVPAMCTQVYHYEDVADQSKGPFPDNKLFYYKDGDKKGELLVAPLTGERGGKGISIGNVFMDNIGTKKKFTAVDKEMMRSATQILADILLGNQEVPADLHLKIEEETADPNSLGFLKVLWKDALTNLSQITPNQLLELAKYLRPPPVIPRVVQATLLVALGCKPKSIEEWDDARKRVNRKLLDKMLGFDPTNLKARKRPYFIRSRKLLKGLTAADVFEKGSYPTQCFFSWVFAAILLRKHAESLSKKKNEGEAADWDAFENDSVYSFSTDGGETIGDDDEDTEVGDDGNAEEDVAEEEA